MTGAWWSAGRAFVLTAVLWMASAPHGAQAQTPYRVGAILSLSGRAASYPVAIKNGMQMAYQELSSELRAAISLEYEDDASETKNAIAAWRKFEAQGLDVLITAYSSNGHALGPLAERAEVSMLSLALDSEVAAGKQHVFQFFVSNDDLAPVAAAEASRRGYRRLVLVTTAHEGNYSMRDTFLEANAGRIKVARLEEVEPADNDFSPIITRLRALPEISAIGLFLHPAHLGLFARQARRLGLNTPFFTLMNFLEPSVQADAAGALQGQWCAATKAGEEFTAGYFKRYPGASFTGAPYGYDALMLIARAARENIPAKSFSDYMRKITGIQGVLGNYSANGKNGFSFPVVVAEVNGLQAMD